MAGPLDEVVVVLAAGQCPECPHRLAEHLAPFAAVGGRVELVCAAAGCSGCAAVLVLG